MIGLAAWGAFTGFDAWRRYLAMPEVRLTAGRASQLPSLSVVVPARDEEANLRRLLPTLVSQDYPALEVVVVDDGSADRTAATAVEFGARIVSAGPLPPGWAGKPHACWVGANATGGDWLLFVDADTEHRPGALATALTFALDRGLDGLTLFLQQRCTGFAEWLLLPYAYQRYFAAVRPTHLTDPAAPDALANGQYLLVSRAAYDRVGGHAAVAGSVIEDVDLARVFKRAGIRLRPARGEGLASVRMYAGLTAIRAGFGKNSYAFLAADAGRGLQIAFGTVAAGATGPAILCALRSDSPSRRRAAFLTYAAAALGLSLWACRFGAPVWIGLLQPLAAALFQLIALESAARTLLGTVTWKGRRYGPAGSKRS